MKTINKADPKQQNQKIQTNKKPINNLEQILRLSSIKSLEKKSL